MSYESLKNKVVLAKKSHMCHGCLHMVRPFNRTLYTVGKMDGDFVQTYYCECCFTFMEEFGDFWDSFDGVLFRGDIWEHPDYKNYREKFYGN